VAHDLAHLGPFAALRLQGGPYELRHLISDAREHAEFLTFHFHGVAVGRRYDMTLDRGDNSEPATLFQGASLDSFIEGIGELEERPVPITVHVPRPEERREDEEQEAFDE
jgi:hypothetical protein